MPDRRVSFSPPEEPPPPPSPLAAVSSKDEDQRSPRSGNLKSSSLRGNLTRNQLNKDPLFYYEVVSVLGVGSMGSVAKVKKRQGVVGGSARKGLQDHFRRERRLRECFRLPLVGGVFQFCLKGYLEYRESETAFVRTSSRGSPSNFSDSASSSLLNATDAEVEDYNDGHGLQGEEEQPDMLYAMKSIHLSRVTNESFVDELRNEIAILRTLDHPHIVKAIEVFEHRNQLFIVQEVRGVLRLACEFPVWICLIIITHTLSVSNTALLGRRFVLERSVYRGGSGTHCEFNSQCHFLHALEEYMPSRSQV